MPILKDMNGRREPRYKIYLQAKLSRLDTPDSEQDCLILDISQTGIKFLSAESLEADELIILDVEGHLVLADVRYYEPRGDNYTIGAERIHTVPKSSIPAGYSKARQIQFAVDEYRSRIRSAIMHPPQTPESEQYRDHRFVAAVQELLQRWTAESEDSSQLGELRAAIVDDPGREISKRSHAAEKLAAIAPFQRPSDLR